MPDSIKIVRIAAHLIAGAGVSKVVSDVVKNNTTAKNSLDQIRILVGGTVLSTMVVDLAHRHVDNKIDAAVAWYNDRKKTDEEEPPKEEVEPE